ncbi:CCA tRNA nucleotidyltransferase [Synechococcus sp. UW179A]|uniref:CCA tRNA nucleotidyltransferase n=1 Tax=Synechococcus sp. UW179A TaxID=2575510 RepID=UPI000E0F70F8|nr:CCA tRNA nucleotidyltransferase [Synechococcus sp. UW179A]
MPPRSGSTPILTGDRGRLAEIIWQRLKPECWPVRPIDLPTGSVLVGGAVRDALLDRLSDAPDLDVVVPNNALKSTRQLAQRLGGACVVLDEQRDMARLVLGGWTIDLARQEGETLEDDLNRRDFRLNAIALSFDGSPRLLDPTGGLEDLQDARVVAVREANLQEDPLRLLRGLRLIAELDMHLDDPTLEMLHRNRSLLPDAAPERIQAELLRLVAAPAADRAIATILELELLKPWTKQDDAAAGKERSIRTAQASELLTDKERKQALPLARLTQLLPDAGLKKLRFSRRQLQRCERLRYWIKRSTSIQGHACPEGLTESERLQLHLDLEQDLPALILTWPAALQKQWLERWRDLQDTLFHPRPALNGTSLQEALQISPGPTLGALLRHLNLERAYGRISTREQALNAARSWLSHQAVQTDPDGSCD